MSYTHQSGTRESNPTLTSRYSMQVCLLDNSLHLYRLEDALKGNYAWLSDSHLTATRLADQ